MEKKLRKDKFWHGRTCKHKWEYITFLRVLSNFITLIFFLFYSWTVRTLTTLIEMHYKSKLTKFQVDFKALLFRNSPCHIDGP